MRWCLVAVGVAGSVASSTEAPIEYQTVSRAHMHTRIDITLPVEHVELAAEVFEIFDRVDQVANEWRPGSPLARVNERAPEPVAVPADLGALVAQSLEIGDLTEGAFDVTWGALWDFNAEKPVVPGQQEIEDRLARVDYRQVVVDQEASTVSVGSKGVILGLGGIAKGRALDLASQRLRDAGVGSFSISAGGQVMVAGDRRGHDGVRPWRVGIRDPRGPRDDVFAMVEVSNGSVSTSGDYERFFVVDGVRYHHILDPRTGRPARGLRSATVIGEDATLMDALSTALMVLGLERGLSLAMSLEGVEAVLVDHNGQVYTTPGVELIKVHPPRGIEAGPSGDIRR